MDRPNAQLLYNSLFHFPERLSTQIALGRWLPSLSMDRKEKVKVKLKYPAIDLSPCHPIQWIQITTGSKDTYLLDLLILSISILPHVGLLNVVIEHFHFTLFLFTCLLLRVQV